MRRVDILVALLASMPLAGAAVGAAATALSSGPEDALERYVSRPDPSYSWREVASGHAGRAEFVEAILTSQTWHGITWKHQLFIVKPARLDASVRAALLYIDGGSWHASFESGIGSELPRGASVFVRAAELMRAPVIVVRQVPFEPLFGLTEDALIAYTFEKYFETGEQDWPLLLPMVKSAARAMDAGRDIAHRHWGLAIDRYLVTGSSKRGWTSWLTAAVDPRVASVAPMVIDMLDMPSQLALQRETFGGSLSPEIREFEAIRLPERIDTPAGRALVSIVDPYSYRDRLTMHKLILLGSSDPYWPVDALRVYWSGLPQEKRVLYLPNQTHGLNDSDRLIGSLAALYRYSTHGRALPNVVGTFAEAPGELELTVRTDRAPDRVLAWAATSPTRDFHASRWSSHSCERAGRDYLCREPLDGNGFTALYAEAAFKDRGEPPFSLSTLTCIVAGQGGDKARAAQGNRPSARSPSAAAPERCAGS
jgi:PhoPQ-activated pathogenicity-related protein